MSGYVRRVNEATLNVPIAGVRIGSAKYTRLAQINLQSLIITFSKFAIENVPERGRRYLVIHELSHVREASHNQRFWDLVGKYEPHYLQIRHELQMAFAQNVHAEDSGKRSAKNNGQLLYTADNGYIAPGSVDSFNCNGDTYDSWSEDEAGIISGGY